MKNSKIKLIFVLISTILLLGIVGFTFAYFSDDYTINGLFSSAIYQTRIVEEFVSPENWKPGDTTPKTLKVQNTGNIPVKARIKIIESWESANGTPLSLSQNGERVSLINLDNTTDWVKEGVYYYYQDTLDPNEETSSFISGVIFNPNITNDYSCTTENNKTTCVSNNDSYEGGTYILTFQIETIQADVADTLWDPEEGTLYGVLKNEYKSGSGFVAKYTGSHQDSMDASNSIKDIYHWYGSNATNGTAILNKNNVIFAGQCWQIIRTTDTGGVRMIYNGEAINNQCLNTRSNHIGYAQRTSQNFASNYYYGTDYTYDSTNNVFSIAGTTEQTTWNATTGPSLVGKYTCRQTTVAGTCSTLYLIESYYNASSAYVILLNTNSHYSQFGRLEFNVNNMSPADVGYMYNTRYTSNTKTMTNSETMLQSTSLSTSYWYANTVTWGSPTANRYNLDSPYQVSATSDYPNLVGEYTFRSATQTHTNTSVYYIAAVNGSNMYYIQLTDSGNHTLSDFNYTYTYGTSYTDNGNGTYTIDNPTTINRADWYTGYSSVGTGKYVCKNATNNTCTDLWYTTSTNTTSMTYIKVSNNYKYAKSFDYRLDPDDNTYKYFLDDSTTINFWNIDDSSNKTNLNNAHYTCWNNSGECTTISYIYYLNGITPYYINLTGGKSVETALNEMLTDSSINTTNSTMKNGVDAWYKKYLLDDYDSYIDDTIYCNDRSIRALKGWNPDGGSLTGYIQFKEYSVGTDLSCTNTTDRFSVSNANARLTYKVGLMSSPEMKLLNQANARKTGQYYWFASPYYFSSSALVRNVNTDGGWNYSNVYLASGVRPAISLVSGIGYSSGDGSMADPYIIETN